MASHHAHSSASALTCQRCHQPLILDSTITSLTPAQYSLITSALPQPSSPSHLPATAKLNALPPSSRAAAKIWAEANNVTNSSQYRGVGDSFVLLSDSIAHPPTGPSHYSRLAPPTSPRDRHLPPENTLGPLSLASNLHDILSSKTPISHPLCTDCTSLLQQELQKQLEELSKERDAYIGFEKEIIRNRDALKSIHLNGAENLKSGDDESELGDYDLEGTDAEWEMLSKRKAELAKEEEGLKRILAEREAELARVKEKEESMKREEEAVEREETE